MLAVKLAWPALLPLGARGDDRSSELYLARVAATYRGGADGLAYREARRHLEHLAHMLCATPKPAPRWPAGLPKLHPDLSRIPFARIDERVAALVRERIYSGVASGPRREQRPRDHRGPGGAHDPTPRSAMALPAGFRAAHQRTAALRGVLRAAFESGAMPPDRYRAVHEVLRGA